MTVSQTGPEEIYLWLYKQELLQTSVCMANGSYNIVLSEVAKWDAKVKVTVLTMGDRCMTAPLTL